MDTSAHHPTKTLAENHKLKKGGFPGRLPISGPSRQIVSRENVIAGTDCGFAQVESYQRVHPTVMWAKLETLVEGASDEGYLVLRANMVHKEWELPEAETSP